MLLNGFSWGHALLGLVLAVVLPLGTQSFWPNVPRPRNFPKLVRFVLVVHWDILTANMAVAILILGPPRRLRPGFVELPLDLTDEFAISQQMMGLQGVRIYIPEPRLEEARRVLEEADAQGQILQEDSEDPETQT